MDATPFSSTSDQPKERHIQTTEEEILVKSKGWDQERFNKIEIFDSKRYTVEYSMDNIYHLNILE